MSRGYKISEWKDVNFTVDGIHIEGSVHVVGWCSPGDAWGYGCEPPDGDSRIDDVEIEVAYNEKTGKDVAITESLRELVISEAETMDL